MPALEPVKVRVGFVGAGRQPALDDALYRAVEESGAGGPGGELAEFGGEGRQGAWGRGRGC
jgi:hypothetical protein